MAFVPYTRQKATLQTGSLWKADTGTGVVTYTPKNSGALVAKFGVTAKLLQDENKILAIADPTGFIKKRKEEIESWFEPAKGAVATFYENMYDDYIALGMTLEQAEENASNDAIQLYNKKINILDKSLPGGYNLAFNEVGLKHDQTIRQAEVAEADVINRYKQTKRQPKK